MNRPIPEDLRTLLAGIEKSVRAQLAEGKELPPAWFLLSRDLSAIMPVVVPFTSVESKDVAADFIRRLAKKSGADAVVFIVEAWGRKRKATEEEIKGFHDDGYAVRNDPERYDCISFLVETYEGSWMAMPAVTVGCKPRVLEPLEFMNWDLAEGRMTNFLPPRGSVH